MLYYRPQRSWGKVIFSQASVILSTGGGGGIPAWIAGGILACLAAGLGGSAARGVPGPGGLLPGGCLVWGGACSRGGSLQAHTQGEVEGDQVQAHTQGGN